MDEGAGTATPGGSIRSFVRRQGRMTRAQRAAIRDHWPRYGIDLPGAGSLDRAFGRHAERVLEIGFGMGDALIECARANPKRDFLGIDVYEPGIGRLLGRLHALGLDNVRVIREDAALAMGHFPAGSLAAVLMFFPDPWPKKRHHKRRLVQPGFAAAVARALAVGAEWSLATDCEDYAWHMLEVLDACAALDNVAGRGCFSPRPPERPATKFERRGEALGHTVRDLRYRRGQGRAKE